MKSSNRFLKVGKVKEAHGLKGELFVVVFAKDSSWADRLEKFYLCPQTDWDESSSQSYPLKSLRSVSKGLIFGSPAIKDRTAAEKLLNHFVYIEEAVMTSKPGERVYLREILGFEVFDQGQKIGSVQSFSSNGPQDLLVVDSPTGPVEIPFVEAFLNEIKFPEKQIWMQLPEGLLELGDKS